MNNIPSAEKIATTTLSKLTLILEQLSKEVREAKQAATKAETRIESNSATVLRHVTSTSNDLKVEQQNYMEQKFEDLLKSIPTIITQGPSVISSGITSL